MSTSNDLKKLKNLRENVNWEIKEDQKKVLRQLHSLAQNLKDKFPNLRKLFQPKEIECLLSHCINDSSVGAKQFIEFVFRTGYKDEPEVDKDGKPSPRRTTPIHHAAKHKRYHLMNRLFQIYHRFDVNYIDDKSGLTHFHVACMSGCEEVVRKFLELGQGPNCLAQIQRSVQPPLHLALKHEHMKVAELLLRSSADPNLRDEYELTPLHLICRRKYDDNMAKIFFDINDELQQLVKINIRDKRGQTPLHYAVENECKSVAELLLRRGADPNITNQYGATPFNIIIFRRNDNDELAKIFFDAKDEHHQSFKVNVKGKRDRAPLHYVLEYGLKKMTKLLLRNGANPNLPGATGLTPLHIICQRIDRIDDDLAKIFFDINHELRQTIKVDALDHSGWTPLHYALMSVHRKQTVELLLKNGADPNLAGAEGSTPLHCICKRGIDDNFVDTFFEINERLKKPLEVDALDKSGWTPLNYALIAGHKKRAESLLRIGADPNLANEEGSTPLHLICVRGKHNDHDLAKMLFEICDETHQPLHVDVRDKLGRMPLHLALTRGTNELTQLLLSKGIDPNLANEEGSTPLHLLCEKYIMYPSKYEQIIELATTFFEINDRNHQTVQLDFRDKLGRTPLECAVASLMLDLILLLLDRGADLSTFVFPTSSHFAKCIESLKWDGLISKFNLMARILNIVESLAERGYELDRSDALTIMKIFAGFELFIESVDIKECLASVEDFAIEAKKTMINSSSSIHDLIQLRPEKSTKLFTTADFLSLVSSRKLSESELQNVWETFLCEVMAARFCRRWALAFFLELTENRLPILCCEKIMEKLNIADLWQMCLSV